MNDVRIHSTIRILRQGLEKVVLRLHFYPRCPFHPETSTGIPIMSRSRTAWNIQNTQVCILICAMQFSPNDWQESNRAYDGQSRFEIISGPAPPALKSPAVAWNLAAWIAEISFRVHSFRLTNKKSSIVMIAMYANLFTYCNLWFLQLCCRDFKCSSRSNG